MSLISRRLKSSEWTCLQLCAICHFFYNLGFVKETNLLYKLYQPLLLLFKVCLKSLLPLYIRKFNSTIPKDIPSLWRWTSLVTWQWMNIAISSWDFVLITRMKLRVKAQRSSLPVESPYPKQWTGELRDTLPQSRIKVCCKSRFKPSLLNQTRPSQWRSQGNFFGGGRGWGCEILNPRRPCPCPFLGSSEKPKQITPVWPQLFEMRITLCSG